VIRATAVQVAYAGVRAAPAVQSVRLTPARTVTDGWLTLPPGSGTLTLTVFNVGNSAITQRPCRAGRGWLSHPQAGRCLHDHDSRD
jgi:hypothetical protein